MYRRPGRRSDILTRHDPPQSALQALLPLAEMAAEDKERGAADEQQAVKPNEVSGDQTDQTQEAQQ